MYKPGDCFISYMDSFPYGFIVISKQSENKKILVRHFSGDDLEHSLVINESILNEFHLLKDFTCWPNVKSFVDKLKKVNNET